MELLQSTNAIRSVARCLPRLAAQFSFIKNLRDPNDFINIVMESDSLLHLCTAIGIGSNICVEYLFNPSDDPHIHLAITVASMVLGVAAEEFMDTNTSFIDRTITQIKAIAVPTMIIKAAISALGMMLSGPNQYHAFIEEILRPLYLDTKWVRI